MSTDAVRLWRPEGEGRVICLRGVTSSYAIDPVGECVFGMVLAGTMEARRGGKRYLFGPRDLCAWSPSAGHSGRPHRGRSWEARLVIVELTVLEALALETGGARGLRFATEPRLDDPSLAASFVGMHRALERPLSALESDERLTTWMTAALGLRSRRAAVSTASARRDPALRRARERLNDDPASNLTLAELAQAAGTDRHRLTRLFRAAYGLPPHRFQLARRLAVARALLERGLAAGAAAAQAGFFDQSHFTRSFHRAFGFTPASYVTALRSGVQDGAHPER
jgi:AraC-like DNA-binding protein